jgi:hypothetical protein
MPYYRIVVLLFREFFLIFISQIQLLPERLPVGFKGSIHAANSDDRSKTGLVPLPLKHIA